MIRHIDGNPHPEKEGNLTEVSQFESGKYYWVRYNCKFLIGKVEIRHPDDSVEDIAAFYKDEANVLIVGQDFNHDLPTALKVFAGGMYGPIKVPYEV